jgi:ATP-dependent Clp protease ATP-binding subunit ClpA
MIADDLQTMLHAAFVSAREHGCASVSPEHLLLEMLNDATVVSLAKNASFDVSRLKVALTDALEKLERVPSDAAEDFEPNRHLSGLMQRAILDAQAQHRFEVRVGHVATVLLDRQRSPIQAVRRYQENEV